MNPIIRFLSAGAVMIVLCVGFSACNEPHEQESGLGEEIPGMEIRQATGTVIGNYSNGFSSLFVQVDEEFPIGETIDSVEYKRINTTLPEDDTYPNLIQVQYNLSVETGNRISFSFREYQATEDRDLFIRGNGKVHEYFALPLLPIYVITENMKS